MTTASCPGDALKIVEFAYFYGVWAWGRLPIMIIMITMKTIIAMIAMIAMITMITIEKSALSEFA